MYIFENVLRILTDWKLETIFLLSVPLLIGDTAAIFAAFRNIPNICDALHDLVPFLLFKKFVEVRILHGCFSRFLNCTNGTKLLKV